jgi:hypothetical protein
MKLHPWLYALLCVLAPAAWGVFMYFAFGWLERRRRRADLREPGPPPIDYTI